MAHRTGAKFHRSSTVRKRSTNKRQILRQTRNHRIIDESSYVVLHVITNTRQSGRLWIELVLAHYYNQPWICYFAQKPATQHPTSSGIGFINNICRLVSQTSYSDPSSIYNVRLIICLSQRNATYGHTLIITFRIIMTGMVVCFVLFFSVSSKAGIYVACILGTAFYGVYFIPFWAWRSVTLRGSTGTAFTLGFQNCVGQIGGVVGPQLFQSRWAYNGYKISFGICAAFIISGWFSNVVTWWLTRNVEWDVRRIARLRKQAKKEGRVFYTGLWKRNNAPV
jgi:hypothetical protein